MAHLKCTVNILKVVGVYHITTFEQLSLFLSPYRVLAERERQRAIAKERLAARRQKKQQTVLGEQQTAEQLLEDEEQSKMEDIVNDSQGMMMLLTFSTRPYKTGIF